MLSRYYRSIAIIFITTMPLVHSRGFTITDENFTDLYKKPQYRISILREHNTLRRQLNLPTLESNSKLNSLSEKWAASLARSRKFSHTPNNEYGENIYWENYQTGLHYPALFVRAWYGEEKFFHKNLRFSELHRVSNFTQIIWRSTRYLGVGVCANHTYNEVYLVCMYDPPGNIIDEFSRNIDMDQLIPELETNLERPNKSSHLCINLCVMLIIILPMSNIKLSYNVFQFFRNSN